MGERSIHDNFVTGYSVDAENNTIRIDTEFRDGEPNNRVSLFFDGVAGYLLLDGLGGILTDVIETDMSYILDQYGAYFERGQKYGWPGVWNTGPSAIETFVENNQLKIFEICSAIGFDGFIIAKAMRTEVVK